MLVLFISRTKYFKGGRIYNTPFPMKCSVHVTVGVHMCTKCHCNIFWELLLRIKL